MSRRLLFMLLLPIYAAGCTTAWQDIKKRVTPLPLQYVQRAQLHEQAGELHQALLAWQAAQLLEPKNPRTSKAIAELKETISKRSQDYFHQGLEWYNAGNFAAAQRAFLMAIHINPAHSPSLHYLKTNLQNPAQATYKVQRGDSFIRIASKLYDDPSKAYMIAYFNGMNPQKPLFTGTILHLPVLDAAVRLPKSDIQSLLNQSRQAYEMGSFEKAAAYAEKILAEIPGHAKASRLADEAYLRHGKQLMEQQRFREALAQFKRISTAHEKRQPSIQKANLELHRQALAKKLEMARNYLDKSNFVEAINAAEEILVQYPRNDRAKEVLNSAGYAYGKALLEEGHEPQAIEWLKKVDPAYSDTTQLLSLAQARTKATAETLYRDGVKHFINENLEQAIKAWQQALTLNPDHPKAQQDMENAMRLLEKWRDLEKTP